MLRLPIISGFHNHGRQHKLLLTSEKWPLRSFWWTLAGFMGFSSISTITAEADHSHVLTSDKWSLHSLSWTFIGMIGFIFFKSIAVHSTMNSPQTSSYSTHCEWHQMVQVSIGGCGQFKSSEANVIEGLIVYAVGFVCVLQQLMDGQSGIVRLHDSIRDLVKEG